MCVDSQSGGPFVVAKRWVSVDSLITCVLFVDVLVHCTVLIWPPIEVAFGNFEITEVVGISTVTVYKQTSKTFNDTSISKLTFWQQMFK